MGSSNGDGDEGADASTAGAGESLAQKSSGRQGDAKSTYLGQKRQGEGYGTGTDAHQTN